MSSSSKGVDFGAAAASFGKMAMDWLHNGGQDESFEVEALRLALTRLPYAAYGAMMPKRGEKVAAGNKRRTAVSLRALPLALLLLKSLKKGSADEIASKFVAQDARNGDKQAQALVELADLMSSKKRTIYPAFVAEDGSIPSKSLQAERLLRMCIRSRNSMLASEDFLRGQVSPRLIDTGLLTEDRAGEIWEEAQAAGAEDEDEGEGGSTGEQPPAA
jgi:hypothetical protein